MGWERVVAQSCAVGRGGSRCRNRAFGDDAEMETRGWIRLVRLGGNR
jgi:hypothetical protein